MTQDEVLDKLKNYANFEQGRNNNFVAKKEGATITIYTNGNHQVQCKDTIVKEKIEQEISELLDKDFVDNSKKQLFIVYGHDQNSREQLERVLEKLNIASSKVTNNSGMTIIEALEQGISKIHAGIVLLTPDDMAISVKDFEKHKDNLNEKLGYRARQNVILEMGMVMSKLGRDKTIILKKGNLEYPSDINGVFYIDFNEHVKETIPKLVERLKKCGFNIDESKALELCQ